MKRLIHNSMTVSEQFALMEKFVEITDQAWRVHAKHGDYENINLKRDFVEERFGISCKIMKSQHEWMGHKLVEPRVADEKKCLFYLISTQ